jgi:hypothetical protein
MTKKTRQRQLVTGPVDFDGPVEFAGPVNMAGGFTVDGETIRTGVPAIESMITLSEPAGTVQDVLVKLRDQDDEPVLGHHVIEVYLSGHVDGAEIASAGPENGTAVEAGQILVELVTDTAWKFITDENGELDLALDNVGGAGVYENRVVLVLPSGAVIVSDALAIPDSAE